MTLADFEPMTLKGGGVEAITETSPIDSVISVHHFLAFI